MAASTELQTIQQDLFTKYGEGKEERILKIQECMTKSDARISEIIGNARQESRPGIKVIAFSCKTQKECEELCVLLVGRGYSTSNITRIWLGSKGYSVEVPIGEPSTEPYASRYFQAQSWEEIINMAEDSRLLGWSSITVYPGDSGSFRVKMD